MCPPPSGASRWRRRGFNLRESIHGDNRFESLLPLLLEMEDIRTRARARSRSRSTAQGQGGASGLRCPTPASALLTAADASAVALPFPLIVKPCREDASVGIMSGSVVRDRKTLERRVAHVLAHYRQPALVEQFVDGREIYVSILDRPRGERRRSPFLEIDFSQLPEDRRGSCHSRPSGRGSIESRHRAGPLPRALRRVDQRVGEVGWPPTGWSSFETTRGWTSA